MSSPELRVRPADLGWLAAAIGLVASGSLVALQRANANDLEPAPGIAATVGWLAFWSGPAIVGSIGTAGHRREVVVGAGLGYAWMAALSFSGVTIILLAPAILFLYAGLRSPSRGTAAVPADQPLLAVAVLAALLGSLIGLFGTLETVCWERSADGTVRTFIQAADSGAGQVPVGAGGVFASGCSGGQVSALGAAIVVGCVGSAAAIAILGARRGPNSTRPTSDG